MRTKFVMILVFATIAFNVSYADMAVEPVINKNVHVLRGVTPSQCPTSWMGNPGSADINADTSGGVSNSAVGSGVRSCTGCAFDQASGDCVCATCYDNYN